MKVNWHQTNSGITLFYSGFSVVISVDHPLYSEVKSLISEPESNSVERLKEILSVHQGQKDRQTVESLLGLKKD